jgi:hypothetical protein
MRYANQRCPICGKPIPLEGGIFIAGSICKGHKVSRLNWLLLQPKMWLWRSREQYLTQKESDE